MVLLRAIQESIQASREQMARQHEDAMTLLQALREQAARQHEDVVALLQTMDERSERMHAETQRTLLRIAELIAAEGERTRTTLQDWGGHRPG